MQVQETRAIKTTDDEQLTTGGDVLPTKEELSALSLMERFCFRLTYRMNRGRWKLLMTWLQRHIGSLWIHLSTYNIMNVYGLENIEAASIDRPLLLVANHRSFFDMYAVSAMLFRKTRRKIVLFFPVRAMFFYTSPIGVFVNFIMGWFSMYPPFFYENEKREFDKYSMRRLIHLCAEGEGHIIGFHPEGKRNLNDDPWSYLRAQPGIGKIIKESNPQVVPVFIAGLGNNLPKQVLGNWTGGEQIRIRFGPQLDLAEFMTKRDSVRTHKEIADFLMTKIAELGEQDRAMFALQGKPAQPIEG
jgi:1-acyl-sn-glycerol-3-phosphate acyltransferase